MGDQPAHQKYYPEMENVPFGEALREAISTHEDATIQDLDMLSEDFDIEAINRVVSSTAEISIALELRLENVTIDVWNNDAVHVRVTKKQ